MMYRINLDDRIIPEPNSGCWIWLGPLNKKGYPQNARHRQMYTLHKGPIPKGLELDHLCRVRCCVNPDHLEPVTTKVNILRGEGNAAINARKTHCIHGHSLEDAYVNKKKGHRKCRECAKLSRAEPKARAKNKLYQAQWSSNNRDKCREASRRFRRNQRTHRL